MLQVLGSFRPRLFTATLQAIGKLLENGYGARHDGVMLGLGASSPVNSSEKYCVLLLAVTEISGLLNSKIHNPLHEGCCPRKA